MSLVLFVLPNLTYPPREGLHAQSIALIRMMRGRGFKVGLVSIVRDIRALDAEALSEHVGGAEFVDLLPSRLPYPILLMRSLLDGIVPSPLLRTIRRRLGQRRDQVVVHLEGIVTTPLLGALVDVPVVMNAIDAWSLRQHRLARSANGLRRIALELYRGLASYSEHRYYPRADSVVFVSGADANWIENRVAGARVISIPIAVDVASARRPAHNATSVSLRCVFWGDIGVRHLRSGLEWFANEVMPRLAHKRLNIALTVLGRREPDMALRTLLPDAHFLSWVDRPEDVLAEADVVVLPDMSGTGLKNRTLHAMAAGIPVVGSAYAFEGIPVCDGSQGFVATTADDYADVLEKIAASPSYAAQIGEAAVRFVLDGYSELSVGMAWERCYLRAISGGEDPSAQGASR